MIIYLFEWLDCIYEGSWTTVSAHTTKQGAVKAMISEANKRWYEERFCYGYQYANPLQSCRWGVRAMEVQDV